MLLLGLLIGTSILLLGLAAFALVRQFEAERTLHEVARAAAVPPTGQAAAPAEGQGTDASTRTDAILAAGTDTSDDLPAQAIPPSAALPSVQEAGPAAQALTPATAAMAVGSAAAAAAAVNPGVAAASSSSGNGRNARVDTAETNEARTVRASKEGRHTAARAMKRAGKKAAMAADKGAEKLLRKPAVERAKAVAERRAARRAARAGDTFKRCPPLGKKGAVTCRVHICNGGAGKERACRPYLERAP